MSWISFSRSERILSGERSQRPYIHEGNEALKIVESLASLADVGRIKRDCDRFLFSFLFFFQSEP